MSNLPMTYDKLLKAGNEFKKLTEVFQNFGKLASQQLTNPALPIVGITCDDPTGSPVMNMTFAGKTIQLVFNASVASGGALQGCVTVFLVAKYPEPKTVQLDLFTFDRRGRSSLKDEDEDYIFIDTDTGAFFVALQCIEKSLSY